MLHRETIKSLMYWLERYLAKYGLEFVKTEFQPMLRETYGWTPSQDAWVEAIALFDKFLAVIEEK